MNNTRAAALLLAWLPVAGAQKIATNKSTETPAALLEQFIFHPDPFKSEEIPRGLPRAAVTKFLTDRIGAVTPIRPLRQAEKVIDYYDLHEICPHFQSLLRKKPDAGATDGVVRQIVLGRILATMCGPPELAFTRQNYTELIDRSSSSAEFEELVWLNDAVADPRAAARLRERIAARRAALAAGDYQAKLELQKLEEIETLRLPRSEKANAIKQRILQMPDRARRILEEIKMYLTIEYGYLEFLQPWAARRLRRETWGAHPSEQVVSKENANLRIELADAFYRMANRLGDVPRLEPDSVPSLRVRCLRAAAFFGRRLSPDDVKFIRAHAGGQIDILSKE
jgi:hypothetical protein